MEFERLFEPGRIGKMELRNRIIMPPMVTWFVGDNGFVSERLIDYYAERAQGGAGLIVVEASYPRLGGYPGRIRLDDDKYVPGLRRLVDAIHNGGAKAGLQINVHRGRTDEKDPASASDIPHPRTGIKPRPLSIPEIKSLVERFGEGARRAKEAGFDVIMIHGGSGYLLAEFLSPITNKRTDEYGGDIKGRAKLALELLEIAKKKTATDYPVMYRMLADERVKGGFGVKDAIEFCKLLQEGGIDGVDIVSGGAEAFQWSALYMYMPLASNVHISEAIKKQVSIPISVAGRINDPYIAESTLREGKADFIDVGRGLIADPEFPKKARGGRAEDIRKCIACLRCCEYIELHEPIHCTVNPAVGQEREFRLRLKPAEKKKRVLVVGGGPAGMQSAIISAQRGHTVTLWEQEDCLGGLLNLAALPPGKSDLNNLLNYLNRQIKNSGASVELGKKGTVNAIEKFAPDVVIGASGSNPLVPDIPGIDKKNIISDREVLLGKKKVGKKVIVMGGGLIGCEIAEFLAEKGRDVTLVFRSARVADDVIHHIRNIVVGRLDSKGVKLFSGVTKYKEITDNGLKIIDKEGRETFLKADNIILATGSTPDRTFLDALKGKISKIYEAGDCVEARRILEAIREGTEAAFNI